MKKEGKVFIHWRNSFGGLFIIAIGMSNLFSGHFLIGESASGLWQPWYLTRLRGAHSYHVEYSIVRRLAWWTYLKYCEEVLCAVSCTVFSSRCYVCLLAFSRSQPSLLPTRWTRTPHWRRAAPFKQWEEYIGAIASFASNCTHMLRCVLVHIGLVRPLLTIQTLFSSISLLQMVQSDFLHHFRSGSCVRALLSGRSNLNIASGSLRQ